MQNQRLTKVLPAPDVHVRVIFPQVVEPGFVHHKEPSSYDGSPVKLEGKERVSQGWGTTVMFFGPFGINIIANVVNKDKWILWKLF